MKKGGYKIIDLKGKPLTVGAFATIEGIYSQIESTDKALLLSGLNYDGIEYRDTYVTAILDNTTYKITVYGLVISIAQNDQVSVVAQ